MLIRMNRVVLALLIVALPLQPFAAIVTPHCQQDSVNVQGHANQNGDRHDHAVSAQDQHDPLASTDSGPDHCGTESVFASATANVGWAGGTTVQCDSFTAVRCSSFIPEQPQRPPLPFA